MNPEDEMEIALTHIQELLNVLSYYPSDNFDEHDSNIIKEAEDFLQGN